MLIDCDSCHVRGLACSDCVVSVLLRGDDEHVASDLAPDTQEAIEVLANAGMVPPLRLVSGDTEKITERNTAQTFAERREAG
jgi:hypothetical protein